MKKKAIHKLQLKRESIRALVTGEYDAVIGGDGEPPPPPRSTRPLCNLLSQINRLTCTC